MSDQRLQANRAPIHQIDHHREILRRGSAAVNERQFLKVKIVERQCSAGCAGDAEKQDAAAEARHPDGVRDGRHHAGTLNHHVGAAPVRFFQHFRHRSGARFDHHVRAQLLRRGRS